MAVGNDLTADHVAKFEEQKKWLHDRWEHSLASQEVKWPSGAKVKLAQLVGLSFFVGDLVNKDSLGQFVKKVAGGSADPQARHLRNLGWDIRGGGRGEPHTNCHPITGERIPRSCYMLASITTPHPDYLRSERLKRMGRLGVRDWADLRTLYRGKCAHCGKPTRHPDKGHMDPNKGQELSNLIPLCKECNIWAAADVIFNEKGRVEAVRSERFLVKADRPAQMRMMAWLQKTLKKH